MQLGSDSLKYSTATNDCCCHIAYEQKTVPLDKIQDVELQTDCLLSCFDLKKVCETCLSLDSVHLTSFNVQVCVRPSSLHLQPKYLSSQQLN